MEFSETQVNIIKSKSTVLPGQFPKYSSRERRGQEGKFLTSEELIVQTNAFMRRFGDMIQNQELPETIFFLDKSARPVAYMFRKLFPVYYPDRKMPEVRFINIGGSGSKLYDKDSRPFSSDLAIIKRVYGEFINQQERIVVIDEFSYTGQASKQATEILNKAFPEATVTTMIAYDKLPNWYQNEDYLGVEEYTKYDYEKMALEKLNQELGTHYENRWDMVNDGTKPGTVAARFWEIYQGIEGTIPYVKKGKHIQIRYEYPEPSLHQKIKGEKPKPVEVKTNPFLEARVELDKFCEEIVKLKDQPRL